MQLHGSCMAIREEGQQGPEKSADKETTLHDHWWIVVQIEKERNIWLESYLVGLGRIVNSNREKFLVYISTWRNVNLNDFIVWAT